MQHVKAESMRKLSNFNFQLTKPLYHYNFKHTVEPVLSGHPRGMAKSPLNPGGDSAYVRGGDARRKF